MNVSASPCHLPDGTWACMHVVEDPGTAEGVQWDPLSSIIGVKRVACGPCIVEANQIALEDERNERKSYWGGLWWGRWRHLLWRFFRRSGL